MRRERRRGEALLSPCFPPAPFSPSSSRHKGGGARERERESFSPSSPSSRGGSSRGKRRGKGERPSRPRTSRAPSKRGEANKNALVPPQCAPPVLLLQPLHVRGRLPAAAHDREARGRRRRRGARRRRRTRQQRRQQAPALARGAAGRLRRGPGSHVAVIGGPGAARAVATPGGAGRRGAKGERRGGRSLPGRARGGARRRPVFFFSLSFISLSSRLQRGLLLELVSPWARMKQTRAPLRRGGDAPAGRERARSGRKTKPNRFFSFLGHRSRFDCFSSSLSPPLLLLPFRTFDPAPPAHA